MSFVVFGIVLNDESNVVNMVNFVVTIVVTLHYILYESYWIFRHQSVEENFMTTRKKNGEGNITKVKDGTYKVRLVYLSVDGRRKDRQRRAKSLPKAEKILLQLRREAEQAQRAITEGIDKMTIEQYVKKLFLP